MSRKERANEILNGIIEDFKQPDSLSRLANVCIKGDLPCQKWSILNQIAVMGQGTDDARGMKQWNAVGRRIKAGSKAVWILAPTIITKRDEAGQVVRVNGKPVTALVGFHAVPVFRVEDTTGDALDYEKVARTPPPLIEVAKSWGIEVCWRPQAGNVYGSYNLGGRTITLNSENAEVFFHELAHAADHRLRGDTVKGGQNPEQEIIAEFSAAVLARLYGMSERTGTAYDYIKVYAEKAGIEDPIKAVTRVMGKVQKVVNLILNQSEAVVAA
jgi:hypothetical protein